MIEISCGAWRATVAPECGSNVISLRYLEQELLRTPESLRQLRGRPCLYGIPLLFPANRTKDGCFFSRGEKYNLPINEPTLRNHIHGLLKDAPFQIVEITESSITTEIENRGQYYPFPFKLTVKDSMSDGGLTRHLTLKNTGSKPMPYTLAFHTTFAAPAHFCVPIDKCCQMDDRYIPTGNLLPLTAQQQAYRDGMEPDGSKISGVYTSCGSTVQLGDFRMSVSEQFDHWVLFNGNGSEGYLCIEPQCGAVNGLNNQNHRVLQPGTEDRFAVTVQKM